MTPLRTDTTSLPGQPPKVRLKRGRPASLPILAGGALAAGLVIWLLSVFLPPREPVWKGHKLSEWIEAEDANNRFNDRPGLQSRFTDQECDEALDGIGRRALPSLRYWLTAKPGRVKPWANQLLDRQRWIRFRFAWERDPQSLALNGFLYFGPAAQPLLPELIRLTHSPDAETRQAAFEAAFFTRPDKEIFLPLVCRCLQEEDEPYQAMAAQWMVERFPEEAEQAGLRNRFPVFYQNLQLTNASLTDRP